MTNLRAAKRVAVWTAVSVGAVSAAAWSTGVLGAVVAAGTVVLLTVVANWPRPDCGVSGCTQRRNPWHSHHRWPIDRPAR